MGDLIYMKTKLPGEAREMDQTERDDRKNLADKFRRQVKHLTAGEAVEMTITPGADLG